MLKPAHYLAFGGALLSLTTAALGLWFANRGDSGEPQIVGVDARILVDGSRDRAVVFSEPELQLRYYLPDHCFVLDNNSTSTASGAVVRQMRDPVIAEPPSSFEKTTWSGAVWPKGTTVVEDSTRFGVRLPAGKMFWAGDIVRGQGGFWPEEDDGSSPSYGMPANCVGFDGLIQIVPYTS